jgi:hypothetical protein
MVGRVGATALGFLGLPGLVGFVGASGCADVWGFHDLSTGDGGLDATAGDAARGDATAADAMPTDAGPSGPPLTCPDIVPPPKPAADDPSDAGDRTFTVALHTVDFFGDGGGLGYDIDHTYTCCEGGLESCQSAVPTAPAHCDSLEGRDNATASIIATILALDPSFPLASISQRLAQGAYSILLVVRQYNGRPNDTQVVAEVYASTGVQGDAGAKWMGNDVWNIDPTFLADPDASAFPNHFDTKAYVSNGTLVMHVDFPFSLGKATDIDLVNLSGGILTAEITPAAALPGAYSLIKGQLAGRWSVSNILGALQGAKIQGAPLCRGNNNYALLKANLCQSADIMNDPTKDNSGGTCDSVSVGIGFTGDPAVLGSVGPGPQPLSSCGDDSGPDDCSQP